MSGPKTSRFTLTEEQRRQLAIQRELEIKRQAEKKKLDQLRISIASGESGFEHEKSRAEELRVREGNDCGWSKTISRLSTEVQNALRAIDGVQDNATLEQYQKACEQAKAASNRISALRSELMGIDQKVSLSLDKSIAVDVDKGFSATLSFASQKVETECKEKAEDCLVQLVACRKMDLSVQLIEEIDRAIACLQNISGADYLKSFQAVTINPLKRKCAAFVEEQTQLRGEYSELMPLYETLCEQTGTAPERFTATQTSIQRLKEEIERIRDLGMAAEEQAYISQCVDEAMAELGYEIIGDRVVTKRSGKKFRNELYRFDEGTAVNVTYASDGKITMELGCMDTTDRTPTAAEADRMKADMEQFCGEYHKLEKMLAAKGIISQHISLLPPSEEYAMVINTSDYDMSTDVSTKKRARRSVEGKLHRSV